MAVIVAALPGLAVAQSRLPSARRGGGPVPAQPAARVRQASAAEARSIHRTLPLPSPQENIPSPSPNVRRSLTLAELEGIALANNPTMVQASAQVRAAQGQWVQAGLRPNPIVGYQASEVGNLGLSGQQGAFISQEFVRRQKLNLSRAASSGDVAQAQQAYAIARQRVLNDIRSEFFNVLVAQRAMQLTDELLQIGRRAVDTTQSLYRSEQIAYVDVLQARIEYDAAQIGAQNARNRQAAAWRRLAATAGVPNMKSQQLEGDLEPPAKKLVWEESLARLLSQSPELASARVGVSRARAVLARAEVETRPNVFVQAGLQRDNDTFSTIGNVQIGVPVPILNRNQGNVQTAYADLRHAQAEVGRVELSLHNRLATAFETYSNARTQVDEYANDILRDARQALDLIAKGYQQQQFSFLTLLTAQRTFAQASLSYLQSLQQLGVSRVAIEGLLLTGSLREDHAIDVPSIQAGAAPVFGPARPPVEVR